MEIRDPVHGSLNFSNEEVMILDTAEYQRLRAIKQLGFSEFSFPGATHNRYIHSIGVCHLAGLVFDSIFKNMPLLSDADRRRYRQVTRLGALLHDVGHGPLSHTTEQVMPQLSELQIKVYQDRDQSRRANHEDYTIKYVTDSAIADVIHHHFKDLTPYHVACLIDKTLPSKDDFFMNGGFDLRPILSQIVSSELDADRMDYLERDSYFCGTNYGKVDLEWLIQNLTYHERDGKLYLALNRRALYSFDDFLISRHHMHLMVYFHHKSIIYEEMLNRYLTSQECTFRLPADITEYTKYNDYKLHENLASQNNMWAQRIAQRRPYKMILELHETQDSGRAPKIQETLREQGIDTIWASSKARLSKYHTPSPEERSFPIYVVDNYNPWEAPQVIEQATEIFQKYEGTRIIHRLYVPPEKYSGADDIIKHIKKSI